MLTAKDMKRKFGRTFENQRAEAKFARAFKNERSGAGLSHDLNGHEDRIGAAGTGDFKHQTVDRFDGFRRSDRKRGRGVLGEF